MATVERIIANASQLAERSSSAESALRSVVGVICEILTDTAATNADKQVMLREALDLDTLTSPDVVGSTQLCRQIKNVMVVIGLTPGDDTRRKRLCIRLAEGLHDAEFVKEAEEILEQRKISQNGNSTGVAASTARDVPAIRNAENNGNLFSIAKAMGSRFSDSTKYSGGMEDAETVPFNVFRASYMTALDELGVPREHRAPLIHHALKGTALDFFHEKIQGRDLQLAEVFAVLQDKFLSESIKLGIRMKLVSLRLADVQAAGNCTKLEAVESSKKTIYSLSQQGQEEYRTDAAMIDVMEKYVLQSEAWSTDVATRLATQTFSFDGYCTALTSWIRATVEKSGEQNKHGYFGKPHGEPSVTTSTIPPSSIWYGEQYNVRRQSQRTRGSATPSHTPRKGNCRRCGKSGHWMAECPDRGRTGVSNLDALRARVKDVGGGSAGTARVLYEIATELDAVELERDGNDLTIVKVTVKSPSMCSSSSS
jgi:hypothetical protein